MPSDLHVDSFELRAEGPRRNLTSSDELNGKIEASTLEEKLASRLPLEVNGVADAQDGDVQAESSDEIKYLKGFALISMSFALMSGIFMIALDNSIISTAIPKITSQFDSLDDVGWYGTAYLLTQMSLQPTFGKIYSYFSVKWTYVVALIIFEIGSIICAAAPSSTVFIIGRAVAGVGASGIFCGALVLLAQTIEMKRRPLFMGVISSMYGIASVTGPLLGGIMTDSHLTWRFCFWINLPFGGLAIFIILLVFKEEPAEQQNLAFRQKIEKLGFGGAIILIASITCLLLALQWGGTLHRWSDSHVWGCLLGFGLFFGVFVYLQLCQKDGALIPMRVISQRSVVFSCLFTASLQMAMMAQAYYIPFFFQAVQGTTANISGLRTLPYGVTITIATLFSGTFITLSGYYVPAMWVGASIFAVGSGLFITLVRLSIIGEWFGYQVLAGIGYGITVQVPFFAVQVVLDAADIPVGSALIVFFQCLGGTLGLAIAQNIFQNSLVKHLKEIPGVNVQNVIAAGGADVAKAVPGQLLDATRDAYNFAITRAFILGAACAVLAFLLSFGVELRRIPTQTKKKESDTLKN